MAEINETDAGASGGSGAGNAGGAPPPPPPQNTPDTRADDKDPPWLPGRLDRERKKLLSDLGIENPDDAKAAIKAYRDEQDRAKSEVQKLTERATTLEAKAKRVDELEEAVRASADAELATLTDVQREAVRDIAGDDPAKVLRAIKRLAPTWAGSANAPAPPPPANTAPPRDAPNGDDGTESPPDHKARYAQLRRDNPVLAAYYLQQHESQIFPRA